MAYAALNSLMYTVHSLADSSKQTLHPAYDHAMSLRCTLLRCSEGVTPAFDDRAIEEARKLEDAIEFPLSAHFLDQLRQDVDSFVKTTKEIQENIEGLWEEKAAKMIEEFIEELFLQKTAKRSFEEEEEKEVPDMVGLSDQFLMIRDKLVVDERQDRVNIHETVVWISGMAGIGKTTLARKIFHDMKAKFCCRAFVRVGPKFWLREVLQAILAQLSPSNEESISMQGDEDLYESFRRILRVTKALIVLDDVWEDSFVLALIGKAVVLEDSGSRILVTSRIDAHHSYFCDLKMRFMNEEESWELLRREVFGEEEEEEECPPQLVKAGKKIAKNCEGLPLLITAVAAQLLSKVQKNLECWERVAEKPNSILKDACDQISEVLLSSYHQIREEFKLCFLYMAAFPKNLVVWRSRIINLWFAEGFCCVSCIYTQPVDHIDVFTTLLERNLAMVHEKSTSSARTKAFSMHCAYWYLSKRVAENNKFLYTINSHADGVGERVRCHRSLAIYTNVLFAVAEVHNKIASVSTLRSVLCTGPYHQYQVPVCWEWKLLRVLDALSIRFYEFPIEVVELIRLRYLALSSNDNLPPSISKLWSLQFLIVRPHMSIKRVIVETYVPVEIWSLQELIHLQIMGRNLPNPHLGAVLPNLTTLLDVGFESCTRGVLESIPKLEKLRIQIELAPDLASMMSCFDHISCLHQLKSFRSVVMCPTFFCLPPPLSISISYIRKMSLSGFGYPWEEMSKIAQLPCLQVLKLQCYAFRGEKWEAKDMRFSSLDYLFIEDTDLVQWTAGDETFRCLWRLRMKNCHELQEIPRFSSMYKFIIELIDSNPLAEACAKQRNKGERVIANYSWKDEKLKS